MDKFGNNMRPCGGVLGGATALGGGTEHQGHGTPHMHGQVHIASIYQFGTMADVVEAFQKQQFSFDDLARYNTWFHAEDLFDQGVHDEVAKNIDQEWHARFAGAHNDDLSQIPIYLQEEVDASKRTTSVTVSSATDAQQRRELAEDGARFKRQYFADVQRIFSRVQHHMHKKTKKGFVPLRSCARKGCRTSTVCKHDMPKTCFGFKKVALICRGIARRCAAAKIRVSGRRNAFGSMLGPRTDQWQSGTMASFAVGFRTNTHTAPNWRLPPMPGTHADDLCRSATCHAQIRTGQFIKVASRIAQRSQRNCTAYYCGYTFKGQPTGKKCLRGLAESLNYLTAGMKDKAPGQQYPSVISSES